MVLRTNRNIRVNILRPASKVPLISIHIPKIACSSFHKILKSVYGQDNVMFQEMM